MKKADQLITVLTKYILNVISLYSEEIFVQKMYNLNIIKRIFREFIQQNAVDKTVCCIVVTVKT